MLEQFDQPHSVRMNTAAMSRGIDEIGRQLGQDAWRLTPATLAHKVSGGAWVPYRHLLYISGIIAHAINQGNARIIVSMPPRHGKSELLSIYTPVWALERELSTRIILTSYGAELATDFSRQSRDLIQENQELLRTRLDPSNIKVDRYGTLARPRPGGLVAAGVSGPITGRGAHIFLIDDFLRNAKDAHSETILEDQKDWFRSVARTRMQKGGSIIILATRWVPDDLIGYILGQNPGRWTYIRLPAFAEENDPLGRKVGEALCPDLYDEAALEEIRGDLGDYFFSALYQQDPKPRNANTDLGTIVPVDITPAREKLRLVRAWDLASTEEGGDYTVGTLMAEDDSIGFTYILDVIRVQKGPGDVESLVRRVAQEDGPSVKIRMEQEPGSAGKTMIHHYSTKVLRGFSFEGRPSSGSKWLRSRPFYAAVQNNTVRMLRAPWNGSFIDEFRAFGPDCNYDDQIDSAAIAFNCLHENRLHGVIWGRPKTGNIVTANANEQKVADKVSKQHLEKSAIVNRAVWGRR